jgi:hypothetical protein
VKTLFIIFLSFISSFSYADAWDNLTYEEAEKVVAELKKNPFIFDYCDCCDFSGEYATEVFFLKVTKTEIVTCDWEPNFYSVKYHADVIAKVLFEEIGANIFNLSAPVSATTSGTFYMNYTWGFNEENSNAAPFFSIIPYTYYGEAKPCLGPIAYPAPVAVSKIGKVKGYKKWYKRGMH